MPPFLILAIIEFVLLVIVFAIAVAATNHAKKCLELATEHLAGWTGCVEKWEQSIKNWKETVQLALELNTQRDRAERLIRAYGIYQSKAKGTKNRVR